MSRVFEALQQAELEKNSGADMPQGRSEDGFITERIEDLSSGKLFRDLDNVTRHPWNPSMESLPSLEDHGESVEQFRRLRSKMYILRAETKLKTILVSSGLPAEGKTFVASNLAISLARAKARRVLLIDGDLRRPLIHRLLGAPASPGLAEYLVGAASSAEIMQCCSSLSMDKDRPAQTLSNLIFIPAGSCDGNAPESIGNHKFEELIATVSPHFDWILIDTPPVLAVTDAVDLARGADGVLLVARAKSTPYHVAQQAKAAFNNSRLLGFVLNAVTESPYGGSYQYFAKAESDGTRNAEKK
jgi:protein-tyrosine kinase